MAEGVSGRAVSRRVRAVDGRVTGLAARPARPALCPVARFRSPPRRVPVGRRFRCAAGGLQVQFAPALVGRRRDGFLAAAVTPAALDRFVALMLEPFGQSKTWNRASGTPRMAGWPR